MDDNSIKTNVLVQDDNEIVNAKKPQFFLPGTEESFKKFLNTIGEFGATVILQEF